MDNLHGEQKHFFLGLTDHDAGYLCLRCTGTYLLSSLLTSKIKGSMKAVLTQCRKPWYVSAEPITVRGEQLYSIHFWSRPTKLYWPFFHSAIYLSLPLSLVVTYFLMLLCICCWICICWLQCIVKRLTQKFVHIKLDFFTQKKTILL